MQPFEILSDEEFDELEALLERYGSENSIASMSMLDGFLTAVVSGPHLIMPSSWLPAIWGGEQDQPEWQSEAELERFIDLVMRHSNDIATTLTYAAEDYFPVAPEFERHGEWVPLIHDWCGGYLGAIELAPWPALPAPEAAALAMISEPLEKMPTSLEALSNEHLQEQATKAALPLVPCMPTFWRNEVNARHVLNQWWHPSRLAVTSRAPVAAARSTSSAVCTDQQHR